ncbi:MAG: NADH-quinone oxidoreductase subunit N [Dehalococcoidia bacterium]
MIPGLTDNLQLLTPEFALAGLALLVFAVDLVIPESRKNLLGWLSIAGLAGLIVLSLWLLWGESESLYNGLLAVDAFSLFFKVFFSGLGIFIILSSLDYVEKNLTSKGEFYGLILFSILGMNVMAQSRELLTAYISLELLSFCLYVLAAYARNEAKSNEAGLKYIIIGAFSSALLLYGISMVYSTLGVTQFDSISSALTNAGDVSPALWVGMSLILVGLGFKLGAVPFHMWAPDVYEGAPFPVTAYLAIASKAAAFALVLRLFAEGFLPAADQWQIVVAVLASITMLGGNLVALAQHNIKRLMAYSSIGQVGIILTGIAALSADSILPASGVMLYLVGYSLTNMLVFAGLISFFNMTGKDEIADFRGLADGQPFLASTIAIGLFSLGGLPIFAGFTIKFYLFTALASQGMLWLAGLAIFSSLISLYYYLQVIRQMYIRPVEEVAEAIAGGEVHVPEGTDGSTSPLILAVQAVTLMGVFWVGVYPAPFLMVIDAASHAILPGL